MRTTIELGDVQHQALMALARARGLRGFSEIVREALDAYLADLASEEVQALLALEGSLSEPEADRVRERIAEARSAWRAS